MADDFETEEPTTVTSYTPLAAEAAAWRAEFERRASEQSTCESLMAGLARGTREWRK